MAELEELVKLKEWNDLLHVLSQEKKASYRQILAAHTSDCCSPQHEPRMIPSLKDVGLDSPVAFEDKHVVTISLKAMHLGQANDNLSPLIVTSSPQLTVRDAQEQTCAAADEYAGKKHLLVAAVTIRPRSEDRGHEC